MAWRQHELPKYQVKRISEALGLKPVRRAHYGERAPDATNRFFVVECKARSRVPADILHALAQAEGYREPGDDRIPVVVFHEIGGQYANDLVVLRLRDFAEIARWFYAAKRELGELAGRVP